MAMFQGISLLLSFIILSEGQSNKLINRFQSNSAQSYVDVNFNVSAYPLLPLTDQVKCAFVEKHNEIRALASQGNCGTLPAAQTPLPKVVSDKLLCPL